MKKRTKMMVIIEKKIGCDNIALSQPVVRN